jgi:hypothetical protein
VSHMMKDDAIESVNDLAHPISRLHIHAIVHP